MDHMNINSMLMLTTPILHNYYIYNMKTSSWLLMIILPLLLVHVDALSFNRTDFRNWPAVAFYGDAVANGDGVGLTLNSEKNDSVGRVVFAEEMLVRNRNPRTGNTTADFDTTFSFSMTIKDNPPHRGDGFAFFLTGNGPYVPPDAFGGCLALISHCEIGNTTVKGLVAVEFDIHQNDFDTSSSHIGININSMHSVKNVTLTSNWTSGSRGFARIWYASQTKTLFVTVSYRDHETYELSHQLDLSQVLPEGVHFGFSASTGHATSTHHILSWEFNSTNNFSLVAQDPRKEGGGEDRVLVVACVIGGSLLVLLGAAFFCAFRYRRKRNRETAETEFHVSMDREFEHDAGPKKFSYKELVRATNSFSEHGKLGEGGFGEVYKGHVRNLNLTVAVKRVSKRSKQGRREYISEVKIISRLRHKNLVRLIGWCHENNEFLLIYEFLPNGSLASHLFGRKRNNVLSWEVRHKILLGLASALLYLHEESEQCVLHRDIKCSNIMLDSNFNAKLGDFGLARLMDEAASHRTTGLAGTLGYMAPEYISTSKASKASDVYSFGVVALEIACGRKSIQHCSEEEADRVSLVGWVWGLFGGEKLLDVVDERLGMEFDLKQMESLLTVGLWCVHPDPNLRPSIQEVTQVLSFESPLPDLPKNMPVPNYQAPHHDDSAAIMFPSSTITYSSVLLGR